MTDRKLFIAIKDGKKVFVDNLTDRTGTFLCPHCKAEVIPKLGEKNIWHFAHKGEVCSFLKVTDAVESKETKLENMKTTSDIEMPESKTYKCKKCGNVGNKEFGIKLDDWYCKECYLN